MTGAMLLLLLPAVAANTAGMHEVASVCTDLDRSCANWAENGECIGERKDVVRFLCPGSCGICQPDCKDDDMINCPRFAAHGECHKNPDYMGDHCKMSCGFCSPVCKDTNSRCTEWADAGKCNEEHDFMMRACPVACGTCFSTCADRHDSCPRWAQVDQCQDNPGYLYAECPHSCGVCNEKNGAMEGKRKIDYACADHNVTQCQIWNGSDECTRNPLAVVPLCPETCGACTTICHDKKPECAQWAQEGECIGNNSKALDIECPASCGLCAKLFDPIHIKTKDEL